MFSRIYKAPCGHVVVLLMPDWLLLKDTLFFLPSCTVSKCSSISLLRLLFGYKESTGELGGGFVSAIGSMQIRECVFVCM